MGIAQLPKLYTEREVADYLEVSIETVRRERRRGNISHTKIGKKIRYTQQHIQEYLHEQTCPANDSKSETTGSQSGQTAQSGAQPGSTTLVDKQNVHHLAQQTFKKRKSV